MVIILVAYVTQYPVHIQEVLFEYLIFRRRF